MSFRASVVIAVLALFPATAGAFVRTQTAPDSGIDTSWPTRNLTWSLSQPNGAEASPGLSFDDALNTITTSFLTWQAVSCTELSFSYAGGTSRIDVGYDPNASNNLNLFVFRSNGDCSDPSVVSPDDACQDEGEFACSNEYNCWEHDDAIYALTTTTYDETTGLLVDSDTEFNANPATYLFTDMPEGTPACAASLDLSEMNCDDAGVCTRCADVDVQNTATHEIGHYLGMAHTPIQTATMYAYADLGETSKRYLTSDDISGICSIYPRWTPPPPSSGCASGGSTVLAALIAGFVFGRKSFRRDS